MIEELKHKDLMGMVAWIARVSNPAGQQDDTDQMTQAQKDEKLVNYLIRNHHWSPLEMVSVTMEINTTRDIARQILRHRSFSFQEFSQRYAKATDLGFELKECRMQDTKNRQNSIELTHEDGDLAAQLALEWDRIQNGIISDCTTAYQWAIDNGIAKEQARAVMPEGMTKSRLYMAGTLRSWVHYIALRSGNGTQKEHREIAIECKEALAEAFPAIQTIKSDH
jgi:thymidylate synthase (FAD)